MQPFREYNEIENSYRTKTIDMIVEMGLSTVEWVVTIKVHGCNFSMWYDGVTFRTGKRSSLIDENDNFYNCKKIITDNKDKIISIYKQLNLIPEQDTLVVFGELFGGGYPHKDVPISKIATQVQKGIYYHPDNLFYAFDIKVNNEYLNYDKAIKLFESVDIFYAKVLKRGTLKECLTYPNEFISKIPEWLGLPPIENNVEEGVVLKTVEPRYFGCGSRVILKNKNDKWKESGAESKHPKAPKEEQEPLSADAQKLLDIYSTYICDNRLHAVISKIGTVTNKDFGKLMGLLSIDANKDFEKDHSDDMNKLDEKEQKRIRKQIGSIASLFIRERFINIIDSTY